MLRVFTDGYRFACSCFIGKVAGTINYFKNTVTFILVPSLCMSDVRVFIRLKRHFLVWW